jgi:uncharacterized membrane protein
VVLEPVVQALELVPELAAAALLALAVVAHFVVVRHLSQRKYLQVHLGN